MSTPREPQPGDLYAYLEDGDVLFIPPEQQLTRWVGCNPYAARMRKPLDKKPGELRKILGHKKTSSTSQK